MAVNFTRAQQILSHDFNPEMLINVFHELLRLLTTIGSHYALEQAIQNCCYYHSAILLRLEIAPQLILNFAKSQSEPLLKAARALCKRSPPLSIEFAVDLINFYHQNEFELRPVLKLLSAFPAQFPIDTTFALLEKFANRVEESMFARFVKSCCRTIGLAGVRLWIDRSIEIKTVAPLFAVVSMPLDDLERFREEVRDVIKVVAKYLHEYENSDDWRKEKCDQEVVKFAMKAYELIDEEVVNEFWKLMENCVAKGVLEMDVMKGVLEFVGKTMNEVGVKRFVGATVKRMKEVIKMQGNVWQYQELVQFQRAFGERNAVMEKLFPEGESEIAVAYVECLSVSEMEFRDALNALQVVVRRDH
jgi:hypothetical protein